MALHQRAAISREEVEERRVWTRFEPEPVSVESEPGRVLLKAARWESRSGRDEEVKFGVPRIGLEQMLGLFLLWAILTVSLISTTYGWGPLSAAGRKCLPQRYVRSLQVKPVGKNGDDEDERAFGPDNEMAFLRALLTSQREMKKDLLATAKHVGVVKNAIADRVAHEKNATENRRELTKMKTMSTMSIDDLH